MAPASPQRIPDPHFNIGPIHVHPLNPFGPLSPINPTNVLPAAHDVEGLIKNLTSPHFWVRIGEVLVGTVLLIVGVDHIFGTDLTGKAAKVAPFMMM